MNKECLSYEPRHELRDALRNAVKIGQVLSGQLREARRDWKAVRRDGR